jgi:preprotein translocase subunit SecD
MRKASIILLSILTLTNCSSDAQINSVDQDKIIEMTFQTNIKDSTLATGWYYIIETDNGFKRQLDKATEFYFIDPKPIVTKENFKNLEIFETDFGGAYEDYIGLKIMLDKFGTERWAEATEKSIGGRLALIIDGKLVNAPNVNAQITSGMTSLNRTEYSRKELEDFEKQIKK